MKLLILACLVALALAREKEEQSVSSETAESVSNSEESITQINKQKLEKVKREEQQRKDEIQDKIHPFFQSQPVAYPYAEPIPYPVRQQNVLPLAQPMALPYFQSEIMEVPKDKDNVITKRKVMPVLKFPRVPVFDSQIPNLTDGETLYLPLPLLQPLIHQQPQPVAQSPVLPPQSLLSLAQPQILPSSQQMVPYPQGNMPVQALLLYQQSLAEPLQEFYPVAQQLAQVHNPVIV